MCLAVTIGSACINNLYNSPLIVRPQLISLRVEMSGCSLDINGLVVRFVRKTTNELVQQVLVWSRH